MRLRSREFALRIIRLYRVLPRTGEAPVLGKRILRSGTSVGAHYREACRAKSSAHFVNKLEGALQELEETEYCLELPGSSGLVKEARLQGLLSECEKLTKMFVSMVKDTKRNTARA